VLVSSSPKDNLCIIENDSISQLAARGLLEKTGLVLANLDATLLACDTVYIGKDAVLLYSVPTELPVATGEGIHAAQWMPCQGRRLTSVASFPLTAALKLVADVRWRPDEGLLCVIDEDLTRHLPPVLGPSDRTAKRAVHHQMKVVVLAGTVDPLRPGIVTVGI
jgi:hypothetical protein